MQREGCLFIVMEVEMAGHTLADRSEGMSLNHRESAGSVLTCRRLDSQCCRGSQLLDSSQVRVIMSPSSLAGRNVKCLMVSHCDPFPLISSSRCRSASSPPNPRTLPAD